MLVLSRQREESVIIDDRIEIRVVDVRGDKVRLGFVAPRTVQIHRKEIYDAIRRENAAAATLQTGDLPQVAGPKPARAGAAVRGSEPMLDLALELARDAATAGAVPMGCVIVLNDQSIARASDARMQGRSPLAEAGILAAAQLPAPAPGAIGYLTSPPSIASAASLLEAGVSRLVIGDAVNHSGGKIGPLGVCDFVRSAGGQWVERRHEGCIALLAEFIRDHPERFAQIAR